MRFLITGSGRTGTLFLAQVLGRSRSFIVRHEHYDDGVYGPSWRCGYDTTRRQHIVNAKERFLSHDNYGEVNSSLRFIANDLPVDKLAVVIRHPYDIILSSINKSPYRWLADSFHKELDALNQTLKVSHELLQDESVPVFRFERFTSKEDGLCEILHWLGISDVELSKVRMDIKINAAGRAVLPKFADLSYDTRELIYEKVGWFVHIYYSEKKVK